MGGIIFSLVTLVVVLLFYLFYNRGLIEFNLTNWTLIFVPLFGYALIGFIDDYLIVVKKNNEGLKPKIKFALQIIIAALFFYLYLKNDYPTEIYFTKSLYLDFKWFYGIIIFFMLVGGTNAVNLTDGLDGLAAGLSSFALATFTFIAYINQQYDLMLFGSAILWVILDH